MRRAWCIVLIIAAFFLCACGQESVRNVTDIYAQYYNEGAALYNSGKYLEAAAKFEAAGDFENSRELVLQSKYEYAAQLYYNGDYQAAAKKFAEVINFSDSKTMIRDCNYHQAEKLFKQGNYTEARSILSSIQDYKNSAELVQECDYQRAEQLYNNKNYTEARKLFVGLGDYRNSSTFVRNIDKLLAPSPTPTPRPAQQQTPVSQTSSEARVSYVLNTNTGKFHYSSCRSVGQMKDKNRMDYTGTRSEVIAMGYTPCGICHP